MTFQTKTIRVHRPKIIAVCALLLFAQAIIAEPNTARIQGTVTDTTGAAIGAAAITVTSLDTGALFKSRTDGAGDFRVTALPAGNYKASVRAGGFQSQEQKLRLKDAQIYTIHFKLRVLSRP
jgi:hypothetical protein